MPRLYNKIVNLIEIVISSIVDYNNYLYAREIQAVFAYLFFVIIVIRIVQ